MPGGETAAASLGGALPALARIADELGASELGAEARAHAERLGEGRFHVVCVGQVKRGKSTLLNALVGDEILPTGVVPVTSIVTVLRHGDRLAARVRRGAGPWEACDPHALAAYVTEEQNPGNAKAVESVEIFTPSDLLESGMCLVDTPGLGSIAEASVAATRAFVPHVDAALVVLGADPPISAEELGLIRELAAVTSTVLLVLNKADRMPGHERAAAVRYTERVLAQGLGRPPGEILQVSARERLTGRGTAGDWNALVARLRSLAASGTDLVRAAEGRARGALAARLLRELDEREDALRRPLAESEARIASLRRAVAEAGASLDDLGHRLAAAQARLSARFAEARDRFFAGALPQALDELAAAIDALGADAGARARATDLARDVARRWLDRWRQEQEPRVAALYREGTARFVEMVDEARAALAAVGGLPALPPLTAEAALGARSRVRYTEMLTAAPTSLAARLLDRVGPRGLRRPAIGRAAGRYLARLLDVNSARVKNDFDARVAESRGRLEEQLRARLRDLAGAAERALEAARRARAAGAGAVERERERLARLRAALTALGAEQGRAQDGASGLRA